MGVTLISAWLRMRLVFGLDGSDQMQAIIWVSLAAFAAASTPTQSTVAVAFIAGQLALPYVAAGVAKLLSADWRGGSAIVGILSTDTYGHRALQQVVNRPSVARLLCWSVIGFEVGFPLLLTLGGIGLVVSAIAAVAFHAGVAHFMGLNLFLWAFLAALPCVAATRQAIFA